MQPSDPRQPAGREPAANFGRYAGLGIQYALTIALLAGIGAWLDGKWETTPWCLVVGAVLGFVAGFVNLVRAVPSSKSKLPRPRE
jgi:F0F1-type ATP synthase assembly protein I